MSLRRPTYSITDLKYGPLHPKTMLSPRVAPPMIGLGLIEAIPEADIRARADPDDKDGDGISGRTNEVWSLAENRATLGRFGWKAGVPSIAPAERRRPSPATSASRARSTRVPRATAPRRKRSASRRRTATATAAAEVGKTLFDLVVFYAQNLAVPPRRNAGDAQVARGKAVFNQLGCQGCHTPSFTTGKVEGQPHLSGQKIWPYTDLLLHDMGEGLADNRPEGVADGREWRTPPLWGLGLTQLVSGHTFFLHDGRARNLEEAILWHGGEAQAARDRYAALPKADREALLKFVESL